MGMMVKLELSEQHFNTIVETLGNAPYRVAAPVLAELSKQVQEQQASPAVPTEISPKGDGRIGKN
jgi:hypothetical protein